MLWAFILGLLGSYFAMAWTYDPAFRRKAQNLVKKVVAVPSQTLSPIEGKARQSKSARSRFQKIRRNIQKTRPPIIMLGDSITRGFSFTGGLWQKVMAKQGALNAGIGADRIEHILYRVQNDQFAGHEPEVVVLLAGANNLLSDSSKQIVRGMGHLVEEIHRTSPSSQILLLGVFPEGLNPADARRAKIKGVNRSLQKLESRSYVTYADIGDFLLDERGVLTKQVSYDGIHLTGRGYVRWSKSMAPYLKKARKAYQRRQGRRS